jgi:AcrR family transcriptional regulator
MWKVIFHLEHDRSCKAKSLPSQGKKTRQRILARALKIAGREGVAALTIGRLAKELRMSKSGLFAHFRSKQALELATVEAAEQVFSDAVLRPVQISRGGVGRVWNLCDLWLRHIEGRLFSGPYFFTGALFEYVGRSGPIAQAITRVSQEWVYTLRKTVEDAQEKGELNQDIDASWIAWDLNASLLGVHFAYLLKGDNFAREARTALLGWLRKRATEEIPEGAFDSIAAWENYLRKRA